MKQKMMRAAAMISFSRCLPAVGIESAMFALGILKQFITNAAKTTRGRVRTPKAVAKRRRISRGFSHEVLLECDASPHRFLLCALHGNRVHFWKEHRESRAIAGPVGGIRMHPAR